MTRAQQQPITDQEITASETRAELAGPGSNAWGQQGHVSSGDRGNLICGLKRIAHHD